jgi:hypothetical protein
MTLDQVTLFLRAELNAHAIKYDIIKDEMQDEISREGLTDFFCKTLEDMHHAENKDQLSCV